MTKRLDVESPLPHEDLFQALPPLDSDEYLGYLRSAPASKLPPEVLARVFRQLPPTSAASRATLERLFRKHEDNWDHLGPLVAYARRTSKRQDYKDQLQDGLRRILEVLPTERGRFAERSWNAFCKRELIEAWRERHGRRGEHISPESPVAIRDNDEKPRDPLADLSEAPPWHGTLEPNQTARIEELVVQVVDNIADPFVREVASAAWFNSTRPKTSGRRKPCRAAPLTAHFPDRSRDQINRALRHAKSQLAAALLADPKLEWTEGLRALLSKLKGS